VLSLVNVKARYGWSGKSFTSFLHVVQNMLPKENTLPKSYYLAKKILCPNDCILYKNEFEKMHNCPRCGASRYKVKDDDECSDDENTKKGP